MVFKSLPKRYHAKISRAIMEQYSEIEQVGFVKNLKNNPHLDMMGGEFCGNAGRCLAYELSARNIKRTDFSVSGYKGKIHGSSQKGQIGINLPGDFVISVSRHALGHEIHLQGISFLVTFKNNLGVNPEIFLKHFSSGRLAVGLVRLVKKKSGYTIFPLIFVPSTNTLVEETACASGSIAAALVLNKLGKGQAFNIIQPSGNHSKVILHFKKDLLAFINFFGPVAFEGTGFIDYNINKN